MKPAPLEENPNKVLFSFHIFPLITQAMAALLEDEDAYEARSVEAAISLLSVKGDEVLHKRAKVIGLVPPSVTHRSSGGLCIVSRVHNAYFAGFDPDSFIARWSLGGSFLNVMTCFYF